MTRASQLRELNDQELAQRLVEAREEMFHLRFQLAMGKQDNSSRLVEVRREVARVLTLQHERGASRSPAGVSRGKVAG
jgi:large subunit ribosomal protein L29